MQKMGALFSFGVACIAGCDTGQGADPEELADCARVRYRIAEARLPLNSFEAATMGFDLDGDFDRGDPQVDNGLGNAHAFVAHTTGLDFPGAFANRLAADVSWSLHMYDCPNGTRALALGLGEDTPSGRVAVSDLSSGHVKGGHGTVPLAAMADGAGSRIAPGWTDVQDLSARLGSTSGATFEGVIGFTLAPDEAMHILAEPIAAAVSRGPNFLVTSADRNSDGVVTTVEIITNGTYRSVLSGDVAYADGETRLSAGLWVRAIRH